MRGDPAFLAPTAIVEDGASIGPGSAVWHHAQIRSGVSVGAGCTVGSHAHIGVGSTLGDDVKIGNHADVFGAQIATGAFIGPQALLMEDAAPRAVHPDGRPIGAGDWTATPVVIGEGASIGGGARVLPGIHVGSWSMVGAGAVVHRDVPPHAIVTGNPARATGWVCRCGRALDEALRCGCGRTYVEGENGLIDA